ncbi:MAG: PKD domain-containing protein, partial [bacterium]
VVKKETTVVPEITLSAAPTQCSISITKIIATPETVYAGETSTISVETTSSNCGALTYKYTPAEGSVYGTGSSATWIVPETPGLHTIYVSVTDGTYTAYSQRSIFVIKKETETLAISSLTASPQEVTTGANSTITASVNYSGNTANLTYTWTPSAGTISGSGSTVTYTAPSTEGTYTIALTVSDGTVKDVSLVNISVKTQQQVIPEVDSVQYRDNIITAYDASKIASCNYTANSIITAAVLADVDGDGSKDVVFGTDSSGNDKGVVYVLNKSCNVLWKYKTGATGVYPPDEQLVVNKIFVDDVDGDSKKEIVSSSNHYYWYPNRICVISDAGQLQGSYWNPGHVWGLTLDDIDGDSKKEIIAGGGNNDYNNTASVFALDGEKVTSELEAPPDKGNGTGGADKQKCYTYLPVIGWEKYVTSISIVTESNVKKIKADGSGYTYYLDTSCKLLNPPTNKPPTASASASQTSGTAPLTVYFNGSCVDPDGTCSSYLWDFGDSSPTTSTQNPSHQYTTAGTYTVKLTVTDNDGATDTKTLTITVKENQPINISGWKITQKTPLPTPLTHPIAVYSPSQNKIYVTGGQKGETRPFVYNDKIFVYDISGDTWTTRAEVLPYPIMTYSLGTIGSNGKIYITPGLGPTENGGWGTHRKVIEVDLSAGTAKETADYGYNIWMIAYEAYQDKVYMFGGWTGSAVNKIWEFNTSTGNITLLSSTLPGPGNGIKTITGNDGKIYLIGGNAKAIQVFDPVSKTASYIMSIEDESPPVWRDPNGMIYLTSPCKDTTYMFNPTNNQFTTTTLKFGEVIGCPKAVTTTDGKVYIIGGDVGSPCGYNFNATGASDRMWLLEPVQ